VREASFSAAGVGIDGFAAKGQPSGDLSDKPGFTISGHQASTSRRDRVGPAGPGITCQTDVGGGR
jgi:hypothetical protein